jgi:pimeloyl-ACP methyl ester carboxylesterase
MLPILFAATLWPAAPPAGVAALFARVGPTPLLVARTPGQARAVVLIHGLGLAPFQRDKAVRAALRDWQKPDSPLVVQLGRNADVYAFAFSQTAPVEEVAARARLGPHVGVLRAMGYKEIILVGHSAGGLIARHLVEDEPACGVTRVVQVCTPNRGCPFAGLKVGCLEQIDFLLSLSLTRRAMVLRQRADRRLPAGLEMVCIIGAWALGSDGIVSRSSQWPEDLRRQGVPAYLAPAYHSSAMGNPAVVELIDHLVRTPQPRRLPHP